MRTPFNRLEKLSEQEFDALPVVTPDQLERCRFCNSKLTFTHEYNFGYLQIVETAKCTGCGVSHSPRRHTLH